MSYYDPVPPAQLRTGQSYRVEIDGQLVTAVILSVKNDEVTYRPEGGQLITQKSPRAVRLPWSGAVGQAVQCCTGGSGVSTKPGPQQPKQFDFFEGL